MLKKVIELVDRDVSDSGGKLATALMALPILPFLLFVDGAPADEYPIFSSLAVAASLGCGLFVFWRVLVDVGVQARPLRSAMGPTKFWVGLTGTIVALIAGGIVFQWFRG